MTYSISVKDPFGEWKLSGVFIHRQEALSRARRATERAGVYRIIVYCINGVGDEGIVYDSDKHVIYRDVVGHYHVARK